MQFLHRQGHFLCIGEVVAPDYPVEKAYVVEDPVAQLGQWIKLRMSDELANGRFDEVPPGQSK